MEGQDEKGRQPPEGGVRPVDPKSERPTESGSAAGETEGNESSGVSAGVLLGYAAACAGIIGTIILILQVLLPLFDDGGNPSAASREPRLERVDLIARNGLPPHKPALELLVHNGGHGRSVISRARIEVVGVYRLPVCFTQGELPASNRYGVRLPADAKPGDVVEVPIHQQVPADGADRFVIGLGIAPVDPESDSLDGLYLFELEVSLVHDGAVPPLSMGKALVSLDELPFTTEYVLKEGEFVRLEQEYGAGGPPSRTWPPHLPCWQANARKALRAARSEATRSQQLQTILDAVVVPSLSEVEP